MTHSRFSNLSQKPSCFHLSAYAGIIPFPRELPKHSSLAARLWELGVRSQYGWCISVYIAQAVLSEPELALFLTIRSQQSVNTLILQAASSFSWTWPRHCTDEHLQANYSFVIGIALKVVAHLFWLYIPTSPPHPPCSISMYLLGVSLLINTSPEQISWQEDCIILISSKIRAWDRKVYLSVITRIQNIGSDMEKEEKNN